MALLDVQTMSLATSLTPSFDAAASGGDTFLNNGRTFIYAKNANVGASRTITVNSLTNCDQGEDHNITITVPLSSEELSGPYPPNRFNSPTGVVTMTYDSEADLTIAIISI